MLGWMKTAHHIDKDNEHGFYLSAPIEIYDNVSYIRKTNYENANLIRIQWSCPRATSACFMNTINL
jgi:hypothetical protein